MKRTPWFERKFPAIEDNGLFPSILERLEGTTARLTNKMERIKSNSITANPQKWSIKKEIGHLIDLEPLWHERAKQILRGEENLLIADLTNQKTHLTDHDSQNITDLLKNFETLRLALIQTLENTTEADLEKAAIHPRLGTPMRLIDLAFFVAEHDDHHLAQISFLAKSR